MKTYFSSQSRSFVTIINIVIILLVTGCKKTGTDVPAVTINPLINVTTTMAGGGGLVISDGGAEIIERGICWSLQQSPTVLDGKASAGAGAGSFSVTLAGLTPDTRYYVRTYATNEAGTGYSDQLILQTMFGTVKDFDGNVYHTIRIGGQEWMAENLKAKHYRNGTAIPNKTDYLQWAQLTSGAYCWYANDYTVLGQYYGALYNWYAINDSAGICPEGWHVPDIEEWDTMFYQLGGDLVAGGKLKSALTDLYQQPYWLAPNYYGTNESGFSAFPGGFRSFIDGVFSGLGPTGFWWSSTPDSVDIKGIALSTTSAAAFHELINRKTGVSVRCVKDR